MHRQTNRCIPLPQFFSVSYDLITDSQEVKIAMFLKTQLFPLSWNIQSTANRPQIQFHFFSITENFSLHKLVSVQWMDGPKKNHFLFGKFRIDLLTKRIDPCTCLIQNKSTSVGQWGGESSLQQTVLDSRATCMRDKMDLNTIHKTQFLIDFTSHWDRLKNKASRENRGRLWWYWTRKKNF